MAKKDSKTEDKSVDQTNHNAIHEPYAKAPSVMQLQVVNISDPEQLKEIANQVKQYVKTNNLSVKFSDKNDEYVMVEGWQYTGSLLGLIPMVEDCTNESTYEEVEFKWNKKDRSGAWKEVSYKAQKYKYRAKAVFKNVRTGDIVGQGFAICSNEESKKHTFEEYAIMSHAQTRAIGKAGRAAFAFVIKAAGFSPTPAEEMDDAPEDDKVVGKETSLPAKISETISLFESVEQLIAWAGSDEMESYHNNIIFRGLVKAKKIKLEAEENGKK